MKKVLEEKDLRVPHIHSHVGIAQKESVVQSDDCVDLPDVAGRQCHRVRSARRRLCCKGS